MTFRASHPQKQKLLNLAMDILAEHYPNHFIGDELFVANRAKGFMDDEQFVKTLNELAKAPIYREMAWRVHTLIWAAKQAMSLPGDFVECGVFRGFKSYFICKYFQFEKVQKQMWLYDTYEGIDENYTDGSPISKQEHNKPGLYNFVQEQFEQYANVNVIKGTVPESLSSSAPKQVAFLHLDMNSYQAEIGALEFFWPKIPIGGVIILDDYGFSDFHAQKHNEDLWFLKKQHSVLELPTGQGMVIKKHE